MKKQVRERFLSQNLLLMRRHYMFKEKEFHRSKFTSLGEEREWEEFCQTDEDDGVTTRGRCFLMNHSQTSSLISRSFHYQYRRIFYGTTTQGHRSLVFSRCFAVCVSSVMGESPWLTRREVVQRGLTRRGLMVMCYVFVRIVCSEKRRVLKNGRDEAYYTRECHVPSHVFSSLQHFSAVKQEEDIPLSSLIINNNNVILILEWESG